MYDGVVKFSNEPIEDRPQRTNKKKKPHMRPDEEMENYYGKEEEEDDNLKGAAKNKGENNRVQQGAKNEKTKGKEDTKKQSQEIQKPTKPDKNKKPEKPLKSEKPAKPVTPEKAGKIGKADKASKENKSKTEKAAKAGKASSNEGSEDQYAHESEEATKKPGSRPLKYKNTPRPKVPQKVSNENDEETYERKGSSVKGRPNDAVNQYVNERYKDHSNDPSNPYMFLGDTYKETSNDAGSIYDDDVDNENSENDGSDSYDTNHDSNTGSGILDNSAIKPVTIKEKQFAEVPAKFDEIEPLNFRVYSHNVKNGGHEVLVPGERTWAERANNIATSIAFNARHDTIVALQEVYKFQLDDLMSELNRYSSPNQPEWAAYGAGRIDGRNIGEFVPVLYKTSEWELVFSDTMWLNEKDPRKSLEGWDAKYLRICSYVTLKHKRTENYFNVFNTHLDHVGELSRIGSASMIVQKMNEINKWPSILCADLNAEPTERSYELILKEYKDVTKLTTPFNRYGHTMSSVTGFGGEVLLQGGQNIDYIFTPGYTVKANYQHICSKQSKPEDSPEDHLSLKLQAFGMLHSKFNGAYMSDHRPLVADLTLEKRCK